MPILRKNIFKNYYSTLIIVNAAPVAPPPSNVATPKSPNNSNEIVSPAVKSTITSLLYSDIPTTGEMIDPGIGVVPLITSLELTKTPAVVLI